MTEYKVLNKSMRSCHGGTAKWTPGKRKSVRGDLVACENGIHICRDERDLLMWLGEIICPVVEHSDEYIDADDKRVCRWVVIGEPAPWWDERTARHFACDCAEYALQYAQDDQRELLRAVIDISRAYADWPDEWSAARSAARSAAWSAEWSAAWPAAWSAARSSAWLAARAAAWAAARAAAESAAESAARLAAESAAWSAARADLAAILATYMDGTSEWVCDD